MLTLSCKVQVDDVLRKSCQAFDYAIPETSVFELPKFEIPDGEWALGLIVGASGSGKSSLLRQHFGQPSPPEWSSGKAVASHFDSAEDAIEKLTAVGLSSIPSWCKPYHVLSTGEKFRADLARGLQSRAVFDEFTSVVDRTVAAAASRSVSRYVRKQGLSKVVLVSCHRDIIQWLEPDWIFDTDLGSFLPRGSLQRRPEIRIDIFKADRRLWPCFARHHYLTASLMCSARCWAAFWGTQLVGFASCVTMPCGTVKRAYREHRTVIFPDFQGLGLGVRLSDAVAASMVAQGFRYFSKTAHPRMGGYRDNSKLWRPTSKNHVVRQDKGCQVRWEHRTGVYLWSHEYIGDTVCPVP